MLLPHWLVISISLGYLLLSFGRTAFSDKKPELKNKNEDVIRINDLSEYR